MLNGERVKAIREFQTQSVGPLSVTIKMSGRFNSHQKLNLIV